MAKLKLSHATVTLTIDFDGKVVDEQEFAKERKKLTKQLTADFGHLDDNDKPLPSSHWKQPQVTFTYTEIPE